jgi:hypothetical protein
VPPKRKYIARVKVLERHADGSARQFTVTRTLDDSTTAQELFEWRDKRVHDPLNGEFASKEIILTPDDQEIE